MPKLKNRLPKNCRDRNQAFSWYDGKRIYHGIWGSPEAEKSYKRFLAALLVNPALPVQVGRNDDILVAELTDGFLNGVESRMGADAVVMFKQSIGYLVESYGELAVNEFSPKKLKTVRSKMVKAGTLCRNQVNRYTGYIKRIFQWGVEEEIVLSNVALALNAVKNLRKDEEGAFDHPEKEDVPFWVIAATLPFLAPMVAAMVQIQWMLGMRPSEVFKMRVGDIDRTRENGLWYYVPGSYKTGAYVGKMVFPLGKAVQRLLVPYLDGKKSTDSVFSPRTRRQI